MNLKEILEQVDYRFESDSNFLWKCYGDKTSSISFNTKNGTPFGSAIFNPHTAEVFEISMEIPNRRLAYRWINPEYKNEYIKEADSRGIDPDVAWDDVNYTDLDVEIDLLDKLNSIFNEEKFDERVVVQIDMSVEEELNLYRLAHAADMTVNDYMNKILSDEINRFKENKDDA